MPTINKSALVPYTAQQMFELVDNINDYPKFLPWCGSASEIKREGNQVKASIAIDYHGFSKSFITLNELDEYSKIKMQLVEGPFSHLDGVWSFEQLDDNSSKVALNIKFEFASRITAFALSASFSKIAGSMVDAFVQQANSIYS